MALSNEHLSVYIQKSNICTLVRLFVSCLQSVSSYETLMNVRKSVNECYEIQNSKKVVTWLRAWMLFAARYTWRENDQKPRFARTTEKCRSDNDG